MFLLHVVNSLLETTFHVCGICLKYFGEVLNFQLVLQTPLFLSFHDPGDCFANSTGLHIVHNVFMEFLLLFVEVALVFFQFCTVLQLELCIGRGEFINLFFNFLCFSTNISNSFQFEIPMLMMLRIFPFDGG